MAITYVNGTVTDNNSWTAVTPTIPSGTVADDLMIAFVGFGLNTGAQTWDDDGGGGNGWTRLFTEKQTAGRDRECAIYYKIHSGTESNPTFTLGTTAGHMSGSITSWRGVDTTTPLDVTFVLANHTSKGMNDPTPPNASITTNTDGAMVVLFNFQTHDDITSAGPPTNYTMTGVSLYGGPEDHRQQGVCYREITTAGTESPGSWTHSFNNSVSEYYNVTLALKPAAAGSTQSFDAAISGSGLATADLSRDIGLNVAVNATGLLAGELSLDIRFDVAVSASAAVTADLSVSYGHNPGPTTTSTVYVLPGRVFAQGAVTQSFDAAISASGLVAADLTVGATIDLVAAITASASVGANIATTVALSAPITASGVITADVYATRGLAAAIDGSALLVGDLTVSATIDLVAAVDASALLTGTLSKTIPITAAIDGSALLVGDVTVGAVVDLVAAIDASATVTAAAGCQIPLAAGIDASGLATADLTVSATIGLAADIAASGLATADLSRSIGLAADVSASADATASLGVTVSLATDITASGLVTADVMASRGLLAAIDGSAVLTGDLTVSAVVGLVAAVNASGALTADLLRTIGLAADVSSSGVVVADMARDVGLAAAIDASGLVTADVDAGDTINFIAGIDASGVLAAPLSIDVDLSVALSAAAVVAANTQVDVQLSFDVAASALMTSEIIATRGLVSGVSVSGLLTGDIATGAVTDFAAAVNASALATADLSRTIGLTAGISAAAVVSADVTATRGLVVSIAASSVVVADLDRKIPLVASINSSAVLTADLEVAGSVTFAAAINVSGLVAARLTTDQSWLLNFDGVSGKVDCGSDASIDDIWDGGGSVAMGVNLRSDGEGNEGRLLSKLESSDGWDIHVLDESAGDAKVRLTQQFDSTDGSWTTTSRDLPLDQDVTLWVTYNSDDVANNATIDIDGTASALTEVTPVGTRESDATRDLYIGNRAAGDRTTDGCVDYVRIYAAELTSDERSDISKISDYGLRFNGSSDYINCGDIADTDGTESMEVEFRILIEGTTTDWILTRSESSGNYRGWAFWRQPSTTIRFRWRSGGAGGELSGYVILNPDEKWHDVKFHYDGSQDISGVTAWVDGQAASVTTVSNTLTGTTSNAINVNVGGRNNSGASGWEGGIAQAKVVINGSVVFDYQSFQIVGGVIEDQSGNNNDGTPVNLTADDEIYRGLIEAWEFNEGSGSTAYAEVESANDGTITGASWKKDKTQLSVSCNAAANLYGDLSVGGTVALVGAISASTNVTANLQQSIALSSTVDASAEIAANVIQNLSVSAGLGASGVVGTSLSIVGQVDLYVACTATANLSADLSRTIGLAVAITATGNVGVDVEAKFARQVDRYRPTMRVDRDSRERDTDMNRAAMGIDRDSRVRTTNSHRAVITADR